MTAERVNGELFFSLWYERPVLTKILFGILGEKDRFKLIEKYGINETSARKHLKAFLKENYSELERIMNR